MTRIDAPLTDSAVTRKVSSEYRRVLTRAQELGFKSEWLNRDRACLVLTAPDGEGQIRLPTGRGFNVDRPDMLIRRMERMVMESDEPESSGDRSEPEPESRFLCEVCQAVFDNETKRDQHQEQHAIFEQEQADEEPAFDPDTEQQEVGSEPTQVDEQFVAMWRSLAVLRVPQARELLASHYGVHTTTVGAWARDARAAGHDLPELRRGKAPRPEGMPPSPLAQRIEALVADEMSALTKRAEEAEAALEKAQAEAATHKGRWEALRELIQEGS